MSNIEELRMVLNEGAEAARQQADAFAAGMEHFNLGMRAMAAMPETIKQAALSIEVTDDGYDRANSSNGLSGAASRLEQAGNAIGQVAQGSSQEAVQALPARYNERHGQVRELSARIEALTVKLGEVAAALKQAEDLMEGVPEEAAAIHRQASDEIGAHLELSNDTAAIRDSL